MTAQAAKTHFTAAEVESATGTPVPRQNQLIERGTVLPSRRDKQPNGSGDYRLMSIETVYQFAITATLARLGTSAKYAASSARKFTDQSQPGRAAGKLFPEGRTVLCLRSTGPVVINAPYHADFCDLSDHGSAFAAVDIGKICKEVDLALSKQ
jgi:hypothetical protein